MYLQQTTEEGDIIGPFLQGCIEQGQRSLHTGGISPVVLVLLERFCRSNYVKVEHLVLHGLDTRTVLCASSYFRIGWGRASRAYGR